MPSNVNPPAYHPDPPERETDERRKSPPNLTCSPSFFVHHHEPCVPPHTWHAATAAQELLLAFYRCRVALVYRFARVSNSEQVQTLSSSRRQAGPSHDRLGSLPNTCHLPMMYLGVFAICHAVRRKGASSRRWQPKPMAHAEKGDREGPKPTTTWPPTRRTKKQGKHSQPVETTHPPLRLA